MSEVVIVGEVLLILWPAIVVPAVLLLWIRPAGRLAFFLIGLVFLFAANALMDLGGPDSPALIIPFLGLAVSVAAAIAEAAVRLARAVRRYRERRGARAG